MYQTNTTYITQEQTPYRVQTGFRLAWRVGQFYTLGQSASHYDCTVYSLAALNWSYELIDPDTM